MTYKNIRICACLAAAMCSCFAAGCAGSDKKDTSSALTTTAPVIESKADTADTDNSVVQAESTADESSQAEPKKEFTPGEGLEKTAALFSGAYTYKTEVTYSDEAAGNVSEVTQASDGKNFYQNNKSVTESGFAEDFTYLRSGDKSYYIDNNTSAFTSKTSAEELNIYQAIIDQQLDVTSTHIPEDTEGCKVEEYTYTGDTYITVYDLYFSKKTGDIKKYTATYITEGDDDIIQTVKVKEITDSADEKLFDTDFTEDMTDFDNISEDTRLGFCQGVCATYNISTDDMYKMDITTDDLKKISFDKFFELVCTYAKPKK